MESSSKQEKNHDDYGEDLYQEDAMNDDAQDHQDAENHQDDAIDEGRTGTAASHTAEDAKDHHQEDDNVEQLETDNILDYAIEYKMKGAYPPGLTKDKKRAVRKRAQTICIEEGEVYILRKKNKVCNNVCLVCLRSTQYYYAANATEHNLTIGETSDFC